MQVSFVFQGPNKLLVPNISNNYYNLEELNIYVSHQAFGSDIQVFLILRGKNELYDIVELARAGCSGQNGLYKMPINQTLRVGNENVSLQILVLNYKTKTYDLSNTTRVNLSVKNYMLARQVYIAQEVGAKVSNYYNEIAALYEKFTQELKKEENCHESTIQ